ncbi:MAG: flagellar FlbD family protein [Oligoflexales bacterium]|nr:flagellar FlbD family protein [Oligoflexales bacterium]
MSMVFLTKLNDSKILLNLDNVKYIEETPDTMIFFLNGESIIVKEKMELIQKNVAEFEANVLHRAQNS